MNKPLNKHRKRIAIITVTVLLAICVAVGVYTIIERSRGIDANTYSARESFTPIFSDNIPTRVYENDVKVIAHRGYSGITAENTLAAFTCAMDIGADMIELDVQLTADDVIVVFHDSDMTRMTGTEGSIGDFTYDKLPVLESGERIPTLAEALELIKKSDLGVYLELKDISAADALTEKQRSDFALSVYDTVSSADMRDRVIYASFNYDYLRQIKDAHPEAQILCNTTESDPNILINSCPSDYYGVYADVLSADYIETIHDAGSVCYTWTVNTPQQIRSLTAMGVDGVVTNYPGMAKIAVHDEYVFLSDNCASTFAVPALYDYTLQAEYQTYIIQGLTVIPERCVGDLYAASDEEGVIYDGLVVISAYDKGGENNSILYIIDPYGRLLDIIDLGFKAHTGGIAYDEGHDLMWIADADGYVCAIDTSDIINSVNGLSEGSALPRISYTFDGGLVNQDGGHVVSFLTVDLGVLYIGSYCDGEDGELRAYDTDTLLEELSSGMKEAPAPDMIFAIPEHIQGITFGADPLTGVRSMLLSQGHATEDSALLIFNLDEGGAVTDDEVGISGRLTTKYLTADVSYTLPEGVEQIQFTEDGLLFIVFESSARPYRATSHIPNDQVWVLKWQDTD